MTPAERARIIEQQEFEAESKAIRQRTQRHIEQRRAADKARVDRWMGREAPIARHRAGPTQAKLYTYNGEAKSLTVWARIIGVSYHTLAQRIRSGMSIEQAITMRPGQRAEPHTINGVSKTLEQWADHAGITYNGLLARIGKGRTLAEALALAMPAGKQARTHTINGVSKTLDQWARNAGITYDCLHERMRKGRTLAEALAMPARRRLPDRGVPSVLGPFEGTGAGGNAQETPDITFPEKADTE